MKKLRVLFLSLCFGIGLNAYSQGVGSWTSHLPYHNGKKVCEVGNRIFCVTENGLFYFDKEDNSLNKITVNDGLSDIEISAINYHPKLKKIILGYKSGALDILDLNLKVNSLNDIYRSSSVVGSKGINNISFYKDLAYLATDFGVVVLDVKKGEIKETYRNIGPNGEEGIIKNVMIDEENDTVYVHNEYGVCKAAIGKLNLLNYQNWTYIKDKTNTIQNGFKFYVFFNSKLYALKDQVDIFVFDTTEKDFINSDYSVLDWSPAFSLSVRNNQIVAGYFFTVYVHDKNGATNAFGSDNIKFDALIDKDGFIWTAENNYGMSSNYTGKWEKYAPSGTTTSLSFGLYAHDDKVITMSGGYNGSFAPNYSREGFSYLSDGKWSNYNKDLTKGAYDYLDPLDAVYDPIRKQYYLAHYFSGLVVWDGHDKFTRLTKKDSATIPFFTIGEQTRITSATMDSKNNLWVTNHLTGGEPSIHKLLPNNTWQSFKLLETKASEPLDLVIDNASQLWILSKGNSIVVWDEETKEEKTLYNGSGKGNLPTSKVNCIERDRNGQIWVGTDKGVAVFSDPEQALKKSFYEASLPIFEQRPLLQDEQVLSICIDGANRKWFGTSNGVFLFNENATENIYSFNTKNSLLPSNFVKSIAINDKTGEVYFASSKGIVSFWGDATEPEKDFGSANIFPNPINPQYDGVVTVRGLKENSIVKITDMAGKLVYSKNSLGGSMTWNLKTLQGEAAQSGVYLIYSADQEFEESFVGKLVIVN